MLCNRKSLAKTSSTPGKTQLINHYLINEQWFLVDLPGYGYARVGKSLSKSWQKFITDYLQQRENLMNVYVLIDSRHPTQKIDQEFMRWLGEHQIPFSIIFTKADKLKPHERSVVQEKCKKEMLSVWEEMPTHFMSSAEKAIGRDEILAHIAEINTYFQG